MGQVIGSMAHADLFDASGIRRRVLDAWAASPARFREDANAEEDAALGAYRDRLYVELLQNARDAAAAAGAPCRVLIRLGVPGRAGLAGQPDGTGQAPFGLLEVANTGAPLSAAGVEALSTLRASAKRDAATVGRFGVGFAAVLAVTDTPSVLSRQTGGIGWSAAATRDAVADIPSLAAEYARRDGAVAILRLPFPLPEVEDIAPPDGYDTVVRLPLRDAAGARLAASLLAELDPTLLLVLPGLDEVVVETDAGRRTLRCGWELDGELEIAQLTDRWQGTGGVEDDRVDAVRWVGRTARGTIPAHLLADRPVEERDRSGYAAQIMVPLGDGDGGIRWPAGVARVLRAPQPTDEALTLPALVSVNLPLDPSRRHTVPGPLRDWLLDRAAQTLVEVAAVLGGGPPADLPAALEPAPAGQPAAPEPVPTGLPTALEPVSDGLPAALEPVTLRLAAALELVPTGLPAGEVDAQLRAGVARLLPEAPILPGRRPGRDGLVLDLAGASEPVAAILTDVEGLLPAGFGAPRWRPALAELGVRRLTTADVIDLLAAFDRPPGWWAGVYTALAAAPDRDALGALPVPLAVANTDGTPDGIGSRLVTGPRGLLLPTGDLDVASLVGSGIDLRVVHPAACAGAARDILRTLGAVEGTPRGILGDPGVADAVTDPEAPADAAAIAQAVLTLVRDTGLAPEQLARELPWLTDLLLPDTEGDLVPAGELLIPDGPLARIMEPDAPFGVLAHEVADAWPADVLAAVGVLRTFAVLHGEEVTLDGDDPVLLELDATDRWVEDVADRTPTEMAGVPLTLRDFTAVRDLELVAEEAWPEALAELARPPLAGIVHAAEPNYTRWWLSRFAVLPSTAGDRFSPAELLLPGADPVLAGVYEQAAAVPGVPDELLRMVGCRDRVADILADPDSTLDLLDRLGDADRDVSWPAARALYVAAAVALVEHPWHDDGFEPPLTVRTPEGIVPTGEAVVLDAPDLLPLLAGRPGLRVPPRVAGALADMLAVPLASHLCAASVPAGGTPRTAFDGTPYTEHAELTVPDIDGTPTRVPWRVLGTTGGVHVDAAAGAEALARAIAWRVGAWSRRYAIAADLRDPDGRPARRAEDDLDDALSWDS